MLDGCLACRVPISPAGEALIDAEDAELVGRYLWRRHSGGYVLAGIKARNVYLHRLLADGREIDHINRDKLDNRKANLRPVTRRGNMDNQAKKAKSGYRGVYPEGRRWNAVLYADGDRARLGVWDTPEEAAAALKAAVAVYEAVSRIVIPRDRLLAWADGRETGK